MPVQASDIPARQGSISRGVAMPKAVHDLVDKLLADPKFYPKRRPKERERLAWAIANKQLKESEFEALTVRVGESMAFRVLETLWGPK